MFEYTSIRDRAAGACLALALVAGIAMPAVAGEVKVEPVRVTDMKAVFGQVESREIVPARVRIGGTLLSRLVEEGSAVKAGEVIAVVGDEKLALQLQAVDARLKGLESQVETARTELERAQSLIARGAVSQSRLDQLRTVAEVLANQIDASKAERAVIVQQTTEGQVVAPKAGRVLTVPATTGAVVMPGETVARIAVGGTYLRVSLPERHAARIRTGDTVTVGQRGLAPGGDASARRSGRIVKVYPELDGGRVIADVEVDGLSDFFVGERVPVWIPVGERTALAVPEAAVTTRNGIDFVRIATKDAPAEVAVVLGGRLDTKDGPAIEVLSGLRAGDRVITP
ncbi:MAG: efflux RND transporter periplasmic adaptor subunit [Alsobacter sp.]